MNLHFIGNAHLDPAWMWNWSDGFSAFAATCRSALDRIEEHQEFIFTASSAACYNFIEETDLKLFKRIQQAVAAGKWYIAGGWWVESDCNLPSGESLLRQGLYAQEYFYSRFGLRCDTGFCVDSFGHTATLPMILKAAGMDNYVFMRPEEYEKHLPSALFNWRAPSGDEVLAYRIPLHYSNYTHSVDEKVSLLPEYPLFNELQPWMLFYGVGNHGGGPTKEQIKQVDSVIKRPGVDANFSDPSQFFKEIRTQNIPLVTITDEMQPHAIGCYSAHSEIKRLNREAEFALLRAETFSILSESITSQPQDWASIDEAWKTVLLNQFHDTLAGVAIKSAMDEAAASYYEAICRAKRIEQIALHRIVSRIDTSSHIESLIIFNQNSFAITSSIEFELWNPEASEKGKYLESVTLIDADNKRHPTQPIESSGKIGGDSVRFCARIEVPPLGWATFGILRNETTPTVSKLKIDSSGISNEMVSMRFDSQAIESFNYTPAAVYLDETDTWGHTITGFRNFEGKFTVTEKRIVEEGPLRVRLQIRSKYQSSELIEDFILYNDSRMIEHRIKLNWQEKRKVCKLRYAHRKDHPSVRYSIPFGSIDRAANSDEVPVAAWAHIKGAFGIIAPTRSSYSCDNEFLSVTIARSAIYAHHEPPHILSTEENVDYLDQGWQESINYIVLSEGDFESDKMPHLSAQLCQRPVIIAASAHTGDLEKQFTAGNSGDKAIISSIRKSENGVTLDILNSYRDIIEGGSLAELPLKTIGKTIAPYALMSLKTQF